MKLCEECRAVVGQRYCCPECGTPARERTSAWGGPARGETTLERMRRITRDAPKANDRHGRVVLA